MLKKIKNFFLNKEIRFNYLTEMGFFNHLSDEEFLKKKYKLLMGKELNLNPPITFNEKLQWLKIHDHNPLYTTMVDKYAVKDYVANIIGEEHIIPTLGVWNRFDEIDFEQLPNKFVLKCTHDSGGLVICHDKNKLDRKAAKRKIEKCLKRNYYWSGREWPYKDVKPRIIAEKYMTDGENMGITDYKMLCFNEKQKASFVSTKRFSKDELKITFYDTDWKRMPFERYYPIGKVQIEKPKTYDEMVELAEKLATNIPLVRADFYEVFGKIYFGELTYSPGNGFEEFSSSEWDNNIGDWLELPEDGGILIYNKGYVIWVHKKDDDLKNDELKDYKFYCFNGKVKVCGIYSDRNSEEKTKADYYDRDFNWINMTWGYEHAKKKLPRPQFFDEMIEIAEKLSEDIPHVRVDLYRSKNSVYFGELTFYDGSGFDEINPLEWDQKLGEYITLKNVGGGRVHEIGNKLLVISKVYTFKVNKSLTDYKFYCFDGEPQYLYVSDNMAEHDKAHISFLNMDYSKAEFKRTDYQSFKNIPACPVSFEQMRRLAIKLSKDTRFLRVDFYEINRQIYFGELTFYPCSGFMPFEPEEWDTKLGNMIQL